MFGQHHDGNSQNDHNMAAANITADGTLGIPAPGGSVVDAATSSDSSNGMTSLPQTFRQSQPVSPVQSAAPHILPPAPADEPPAVSVPMPSMSSNDDAPAHVGGLVDIKQDALQQLKPLV